MESLKEMAEVQLPVNSWFPPAVLLARYELSRFSCLRMESLLAGVFTLPSPHLDSEVMVAGLALDVEGLVLEAVGALPLTEVAFPVLPSPLSAA